MFSFRTTPISEQLDRTLRDGSVVCVCSDGSYDTLSGRYTHELFGDRGNLRALLRPSVRPGGTAAESHFAFDREVLKDADAIVIDVQNVGCRYFNYTVDIMSLLDMVRKMEGAAPAVYVVDHLNPAGRAVEGSISDGEGLEFMPLTTHRHGLTLGELCFQYHGESGASFPLHIISALASDSTHTMMPWTIPPAPDIPGLFTPMMYTGGALMAGTSVCPGIGTLRPYEFIGAPFIDNSAQVPCPDGVLMRPCSFIPSEGMYARKECSGWQVILSPGAEYHSLLHTLKLMRFFAGHYSQFSSGPIFYACLDDTVLEEYIRGEGSDSQMEEYVKVQEQKWIRKAKRFCLYDDSPVRIK